MPCGRTKQAGCFRRSYCRASGDRTIGPSRCAGRFRKHSDGSRHTAWDRRCGLRRLSGLPESARARSKPRWPRPGIERSPRATNAAALCNSSGSDLDLAVPSPKLAAAGQDRRGLRAEGCSLFQKRGCVRIEINRCFRVHLKSRRWSERTNLRCKASLHGGGFTCSDRNAQD